MTETTTRRARRTTLIPTGTTEALPRDIEKLLPGLPKPIIEANAQVHEVYDRRAAAAEALRVAAEELRAAPDFDRHAAAAAAAVGEAVPPSILEARAAAHEEAQRAHNATEDAAKHVVRGLYDAIEDNYPAYVAAIEDRARTAWEPIQQAVPALMDLLRDFRTINGLYQAARAFHNNPTSSALHDAPSRPDWLHRAFEKSHADMKQMASQRELTSMTVPHELPKLLAAVEMHLAREAEGLAESTRPVQWKRGSRG